MANTLKFGNGEWAIKEGSALAYNDENGNFKPLPFDFTRASTATYVAEDGLIKTAAIGEPRIDFLDDSDGALKLEPQRTNLITYSESFDNAAWNKSGASVVSGKLSPSGDTDAFKLVENTANSLHFIESINIGGTGVKTFTIFVNAKEVSKIAIRDAFATGAYTSFDLTTGSVITEFISNGTISQYGNDFYRISITQPSYTGNSRYQIFLLPNSYVGGSILGSYLGDGVSGLDIYGAQTELSSYPTSYIPTQGSSVTRVLEQGIDGGAGTPIFSNTSAVWFIDLERVGVDIDSSGSAMALRNSSFSQQIRLHFDAPTPNIRFRDGLNGFATIGTITGMSAGVRKKIALRIDGSTLSTFANGLKIGSDYTAPSTFNIDEIDFSTLAFKIHEMRFNNEALTDQELINLTTL